MISVYVIISFTDLILSNKGHPLKQDLSIVSVITANVLLQGLNFHFDVPLKLSQGMGSHLRRLLKGCRPGYS